MASVKIDDFCNCKICFNTFGEGERCPRVLACGHTYCHACLQRFIADKSDCPTCHKEINFNSANDILINFLAKSLSETFNMSNKTHEVIEANATLNQEVTMSEKKVPQKEELPFNGHCEKHHLPNHFKCLKCNEYICGTCATVMHKSCMKEVFPVLEAMNVMKAEKLKKLKVSRCKLTKGTDVLEDDFQELKERHKDLKKDVKEVKKEMHIKYKLILENNNLDEELNSLEKSLDAANINEEYEKTNAKLEFLFKDKFTFPCILSREESVQLSKEDLKNCNLFVKNKDEIGGTEYIKVELIEDKVFLSQWKSDVDDDKCILVELSNFIASRDVVCNTQVFFEKHKDVIQNPKLSEDQLKYSAVERSDDGTLRFECFRNATEDEIPIDFENFLKFFGCSTVIPTKAFLKIQNDSGESLGEVIIEAYDINPISLNFLLSASGLCLTSYKENTFELCGDSAIRGGCINKTKCYLAVVDGIDETKLPERTVKTGSVQGGFLGSTKTNYLTEFRVYKEIENQISVPANNIFGEVIRGLEVTENIKDEDIINECGFLID